MKHFEQLDKLPVASTQPAYIQQGKQFVEIPNKKVVVVNDNVLTFVSDKYELIQHKDAFEKVLLEMEVPEKAKVYTRSHRGKAWMQVYFNELKLNDGKLGIDFGFEVHNSVDKTMALGLEVKRNIQERGDKYIVFCAMRQVCSNGMKIKVPLSAMTPNETESLDPTDVFADERQDVLNESIKSFVGSVRHFKGAFKIKYNNLLAMAETAVPYIQNVINRAQITLMYEDEFAKWLKENGYRKSVANKILEYYAKDNMNSSVWGAYNAITAYASHSKIKETVKEKLIENAWDILPSVSIKVKNN